MAQYTSNGSRTFIPAEDLPMAGQAIVWYITRDGEVFYCTKRTALGAKREYNRINGHPQKGWSIVEESAYGMIL